MLWETLPINEIACEPPLSTTTTSGGERERERGETEQGA